jgi:toxin ParE1/3/4
VKTYTVVFRPSAERDLEELYDYIAEEAGTAIAGRYIARIEAQCLAHQTFPMRGKKRDDIRRGLRMIGFERRATIVYLLSRSTIRIVRIFSGGRDFERLLREQAGED